VSLSRSSFARAKVCYPPLPTREPPFRFPSLSDAGAPVYRASGFDLEEDDRIDREPSERTNLYRRSIRTNISDT
jgi:hypothetical protein